MEVEQGLTLLGITAVEDKLQDQVPETITALRNAGIKVRWACAVKLGSFAPPSFPLPPTSPQLPPPGRGLGTDSTETWNFSTPSNSNALAAEHLVWQE